MLMTRSASVMLATTAARWSLSPNLISSTATVSFSLMMGMTFHSIRVERVLCTLMKRLRSVRSSMVSRIWATYIPCVPEGVGIDAHEPALPDGRAGLLFGHALEFAGDAHAVLARGDGPGGDDDDVVALPDEFRHLVDELLDDVAVQSFAAREDTASDFHDDPPDVGEDLLSLSAHVLPEDPVSVFSRQPRSGRERPLP